MTYATTNQAEMTNWLVNLLLPNEQKTVAIETTDDLINEVKSWNPAEIGDAIGSIISGVCMDRRGRTDLRAAQRFASSDIIKKSVGMRRMSRHNAMGDMGKLPMALAGLEETLRIASQILEGRVFGR